MARAARGIKQPNPNRLLRQRVGVSPLTVVSVSSASTGVKISELPVALAASDTDQVEVNQGGVSKRLTLDQVASLVADGGLELDIEISPTANPTGSIPGLLSTYTALNLQTTTSNASNREFVLSVGLTSNLGSAASGNNQDKVGIYSGVTAQAGSGNLWALNTVSQVEAGSGSVTLHGYELDVNNNSTDRLLPANPSGWTQPYIAGLSVTGAGAFRSTVACAVGGGKWQFGHAVFGDVSDSAFYESTNPGSTYGLNLQGAHTYGVYVASSAAVNHFNGPVAVNMSGLTHISGTFLDVRANNANSRMIVQQNVVLADGFSIYSVNDANSVTKGMEFGASAYQFSGGAANFAGAITAPSITLGTDPIGLGNKLIVQGFATIGTASGIVGIFGDTGGSSLMMGSFSNHAIEIRANNATVVTIGTGGTMLVTGNLNVLTGTAIGAGSATQFFVKGSSTANFGIFYGSGAPGFAAAANSLYVRSDGSTTTTRLYVNTTGSTTWATVTTSA